MSKYDFLDDYSNKELAEMIPIIQKKMKQNEKAEKDALKKQIAALVAEGGYTLDEIVGNIKTKRPVKPKYQNPNDASQTWTGRGRKPKWVVELLDSGMQLEDFAI